MTIVKVLFFIIFCGLIGLILRRNILSSAVSLLQITLGIVALLFHFVTDEHQQPWALYWIIFVVFIFLLFLYAVAAQMIKRRSTLNVNELTELRG